MSTYHRISIFMRSHIVSHHHGHELTFTDTLRSPTDRNIFAAREKNDCLYSVVRWCPFTRTSLSLSLSLWIYVFVCLYIFSWCLFSADETNKAKVSFALCSFTVRHTYKKNIRLAVHLWKCSVQSCQIPSSKNENLFIVSMCVHCFKSDRLHSQE